MKSDDTRLEETSTYVEDVDMSNTEGKCVLIDPRRRDLMFCIHEGESQELKISQGLAKKRR